MPRHLEQQQRKLEKLRDAPSADVERNRLKQELLTITSKRVDCIRAYVVSRQRTLCRLLRHPLTALVKDLMRGAIKEQEGAARAGLEFLQVSANKAALEAMCKDQAEAIAQAQDVALDGKLCTCDRLW